ncbi:hypothetical protein [Tomitella gaofuii]|uniref:hypothetical protein n=1 Tax=Tomitella gaofuii TaxID=2760083 RepID=UPI0015F879C2|nr:hypothetical protein [Tomitella gaofuii]
MPDDVIARAELAMDSISEGPWHVDHPTGFPSVWQGEPHRDAALVCPSSMPGDEGEANAAFIAAAPALVRDLMAALQAARATNTRLNKRCQLADRALAEKVSEHAGRSFGRGLANWAATKYREERDEARAEVDDALDQAALREAAADLLRAQRDEALEEAERLREGDWALLSRNLYNAEAVRDEARSAIARVRELADDAPWVKVHAGGGNMVDQKRLVPAGDLLRALDGDVGAA